MSEEHWNSLPRMLNEICEGGCGEIRSAIYRREWGDGFATWECRGCWTTNQAKAEGRYIG